MDAYTELTRRFATAHILYSIQMGLDADREMALPAGAYETRGEELALLARLHHEAITGDDMSDLLDAADDSPPEDPWDRANLREMRRLWTYAGALDGDLVSEFEAACNASVNFWRTGKDDFEGVAPRMQRVLNLQRERAQRLAEMIGVSPYDALIGQWQPGIAEDDVIEIFQPLEAGLPALLQHAIERQEALGDLPALEGPFREADQRQLAIALMTELGFDFTRGRLGKSVHPFCTDIINDTRISTFYKESTPLRSLMAVLHETGHGLYEQGRPKAWLRQPVGADRGMAIHESQSLLIEMVACRSPEYIAFIAPLLRMAFNGQGEAYAPENLLRHVRRVGRGLIRVDADAVSYPLHVILRFRLERAMINGELDMADLPDAWNSGMEELLGITPTDFATGCLQDTHWVQGLHGYFPSYTLGAIAAVQLWDAALEAHPQIRREIGMGDFSTLLTWLRAHVHQRGCVVDTHTLLTEATGRSFDPENFLSHLRRRYIG